jgi:hypothetical protein
MESRKKLNIIGFKNNPVETVIRPSDYGNGSDTDLHPRRSIPAILSGTRNQY